MSAISISIPIFLPGREPDRGFGEKASLRREQLPSSEFIRKLRAAGYRPLKKVTPTWSLLPQDEFERIYSFLTQRLLGGVAPFQWTPPDPIESPGYLPEFDTVPGGSLSSRSYDIGFSWHAAGGVSRESPRVTVSVPASQLVRVKIPCLFPHGVTGFRVYFDGEEQAVVTSGVLQWTEPTSGKAIGALPPSSNTLTPPRLYVLEADVDKTRDGPSTWTVRAEFREIQAYVTESPV